MIVIKGEDRGMMVMKMDTDIFEVIMKRRSIRKYMNTPVEDEKIQKCLEAARWAPSASNKQPWHFIVVKNENTRKILADLHPYGRFMKDSPVVIVVLGDPRQHPKYYMMDPCIATQNFLLAAHAQGLGTCWMGVAGVDFEKDMKRILHVPDHMSILCCVSLGYPAESPSSSRRPLSDMVSHEQFGQ
jgi:nitroreductase